VRFRWRPRLLVTTTRVEGQIHRGRAPNVFVSSRQPPWHARSYSLPLRSLMFFGASANWYNQSRSISEVSGSPNCI
jgi:hypothetical protein